MFSRSLMCCRLQPVSSRLRSDSCCGSRRLCAFLRSLGLAGTQQEAVLPISGRPVGWRAGRGERLNAAPEATGHPIPASRRRRRQRSPQRRRRVRIAASSPGSRRPSREGLSPGMDSHFHRCSSGCAPTAAGSARADMALRGASLRPAQMSAGGFRCRLDPGASRISAGAAGRGRKGGGEGYEMGDENPRKRFRFRRLIRLFLWLLDFKYKEKKHPATIKTIK